MIHNPSYYYRVSPRWDAAVDFDSMCRTARCFFGDNLEPPVFVLENGTAYALRADEDGLMAVETLPKDHRHQGSFDMVIDCWITANRPALDRHRMTPLIRHITTLLALGDGRIAAHTVAGPMCLTTGAAMRQGDRIHFLYQRIGTRGLLQITGIVDGFQECRISDCNDTSGESWEKWEDILADEFSMLADDLLQWRQCGQGDCGQG